MVYISFTVLSLVKNHVKLRFSGVELESTQSCETPPKKVMLNLEKSAAELDHDILIMLASPGSS